jgi:hypothetical protein
MSGTTSLAELPTSSNLPVQPAQNIQMDINTKIENNVNERTEDPTIKQKEYNSIISGIQQASASGVTGLPVRDIPQTQTALTQDVQVQPNYVPDSRESDYIGSVSDNDEIIRRQQQQSNKNDSMTYLYEELHTPVLISLLYFIFQLPILKNTLFKFVPALFNKDGNPKLTGYVAQSVIFGGLFYSISQILTYVGDF